MVLVRDTSSCHGNYLCQITFNSHHALQTYGSETNRFHWSLCTKLSADCDLDLWPSDMVLVRDTSSCHDAHLCQMIFRSHYVWLSYGPDTILEHTHTDRVNSICPSAISWRGHKKTVAILRPFNSIAVISGRREGIMKGYVQRNSVYGRKDFRL